MMLFRCVLSRLQDALPLTFSISATQAVNVLITDSEDSVSGVNHIGGLRVGAVFVLFCFLVKQVFDLSFDCRGIHFIDGMAISNKHADSHTTDIEPGLWVVGVVIA